MAINLFVKYVDAKPVDMGNGMFRRTLAWGEKLMGCEVEATIAGVGVPTHHHPAQQVSFCAAGSLDFVVDGVTHFMEMGDTIYVAPEQPHSVVFHEAGTRLVDVYTPIREEFF